MAKKTRIKQAAGRHPEDMAQWQQMYPHDLDVTMEFTKDKHGNVDGIITTTDHLNITDRPMEIPANGHASMVIIYAAGQENLPNAEARALDPVYFYQLFLRRMIHNHARFFDGPEKMIQHLAAYCGLDHLLVNPAPPGHFGQDTKPKGPGKKWRKVSKRDRV